MVQAIGDAPRLRLTAEQQKLAADYLPMARCLARSFKATWPSLRDEFDSAAALALVEAARSFDPTRGLRFATFARYRIWGALRSARRNDVPLGFRKDPGQAPYVFPMTQRSEEIGRVLVSRPEQPVGRNLEDHEQMERWLRTLPRQQAVACRHLYLNAATYSEIAQALACTKSRVAHMHRQAMSRLNWALADRVSAPARPVASS